MRPFSRGAGTAGLRDPSDLAVLAEIEIARAWMAQWFEPAPLPQIRDAATGDPILLVTDHYRVLDAALGDVQLTVEPRESVRQPPDLGDPPLASPSTARKARSGRR